MKDILRSFNIERIFFLLLFVLVFPPLTQAASESSYVIDDFTGRDVTVSAPDMINMEVLDSNLILSFDCTENQKRFVHIPLQHDADDQKLRVTISEADRIPYMGKFETNPSGHPIRSSYEHNYLVYQNNPVEFSLQNKHYDGLSFYFKCRKALPGVIGKVQIDKIEIVPETFTDDRGFAYILAEILLFLFVLPGFLIYTLLQGGGNKIRLLALLTPLSIFFFLILYLVLLVNQKISPLPDTWVLLTSYSVFNLLLLFWLGRKKELRTLFANCRLVSFEMLAIFIVMFVVTALLTKNLELPLLTFTYNELRSLTYGAFGAHDPVFQYVNGIAILQSESFSKYYEHGKLFYEVQDRGMIVGVMYAVMRGIGNPINSVIANSYGYYTLFGSVLNVLVLLPVLALHKYFFTGKERPLLIVLLISASAFVVTNYYITWFKLAGAGLVISGIVLLLVDKKNTKEWLLTGVIWGLATNFHPSLALTYPIVTLWLLYRFFKAREYQFTPAILAFTILIGSFAVMNVPWAVVKSKYYHDTNRLFRQHFLASEAYSPKRGIVGSIKSFGHKYTMEEQVVRRSERLIKSFRVEEVLSLFTLAKKEKWQKVLSVWNRLEASYIAFIFIPLILLFALSSGARRLLPATAWEPPLTQHAEDARWLIITQALTVFLILIGSFGTLSPDITWHIPMSCTIILMYILIQRSIALGKVGAALIVAYSLFTHYRLFFQFF